MWQWRQLWIPTSQIERHRGHTTPRLHAKRAQLIAQAGRLVADQLPPLEWELPLAVGGDGAFQIIAGNWASGVISQHDIEQRFRQTRRMNAQERWSILDNSS